jgi:hypothetical protein
MDGIGVQQQALGGESAHFSRQKQTGWQHKHITGGHEKNPDHSCIHFPEI